MSASVMLSPSFFLKFLPSLKNNILHYFYSDVFFHDLFKSGQYLRYIQEAVVCLLELAYTGFWGVLHKLVIH